jgi:hypothetical protein
MWEDAPDHLKSSVGARIHDIEKEMLSRLEAMQKEYENVPVER